MPWTRRLRASGSPGGLRVRDTRLIRTGLGAVGKYRDQAFILDRWSKRLVVYYTERGEKTHIRKYGSEDAACRDLLARLRGETVA